MSDETTSTGGWSSTDAAGSTPQSQDPGAGERAGFCQDCGKPLTTATVRQVGTGVFCEPCLHARVGVPSAAPGYATPGYTTVPPYGTVPPRPMAPRDPSPGLAAILGFIPGAGAVYNGQYGKGIAHLVVFVILCTLASDVNGLFGLFIAGWEIYMVFEAYHTALAMRDGLALPNPFGFNDIGERVGFGKNWGVVARVNVAGSGSTAAPDATTGAATPGYAPVGGTAPGYVPVGTAPDWVGYVPPTAFGAAAAQQEAMAAQAREQAAQSAAYYSQVPYAPTYAGPAYATVPPVTVLPTEVPSRRFPVGAIWLIGLGVLILLANILPDWQMSARWWPPILLAGLSTWLFTRRIRSGVRLICIIRWPVILMTLAIMFALHAANLNVTFGLTVSVLLIVFGGLLLLERTAGASAVYEPPVSYSVVPSSTDAEAEAARSRAAFTESETDNTKGGQ